MQFFVFIIFQKGLRHLLTCLVGFSIFLNFLYGIKSMQNLIEKLSRKINIFIKQEYFLEQKFPKICLKSEICNKKFAMHNIFLNLLSIIPAVFQNFYS